MSELPVTAPPREASRKATIEALREGHAVTDIAFDRLYPERIRKLSPRFWTPVTVALRTARLFQAHGARRVLDIGAGVGKLCVIGALATDIEFTGIEHREALARIGQGVIDTYGVERARLVTGSLDAVDFAAFDGFYLFNPFEEGSFSPSHWVDRTVALSEEQARRDVEHVQRALAAARAGTVVITFHGLGGDMPAGYRHLPEETRHTSFLRLWIKD
jgi:SAM-dependent methyltransferase